MNPLMLDSDPQARGRTALSVNLNKVAWCATPATSASRA